MVARLGSLGNHPESHIVAFTVSKGGAAALELMRFGYVTSFGQKAGVIEARWEEHQRGYQVYRFALQQGKCSIRRVPLMEYRPERVASIIEARFAIVKDGGIRKAVAARHRMLRAEVGQTIVFLPSDVEAEAELTQRGLKIRPNVAAAEIDRDYPGHRRYG